MCAEYVPLLWYLLPGASSCYFCSSLARTPGTRFSIYLSHPSLISCNEHPFNQNFSRFWTFLTMVPSILHSCPSQIRASWSFLHRVPKLDDDDGIIKHSVQCMVMAPCATRVRLCVVPIILPGTQHLTIPRLLGHHPAADSYLNLKHHSQPGHALLHTPILDYIKLDF